MMGDIVFGKETIAADKGCWWSQRRTGRKVGKH
jgi:hypothetical protein